MKWWLFIFILFQNFIGSSIFGNQENSVNKIIKNTPLSPDFNLEFQRPSYIEKENNNDDMVYVCDKTKDKCKVNLNLTQLGNGKKLSSTLICEIKSGFESDQFERCNPNTVIFPKGINTLSITVSEKKDSENFSTIKIIILNGEVDHLALQKEKEMIKDFITPRLGETKTVIKRVYSGEVLMREYYSSEPNIAHLDNSSTSSKEVGSEQISASGSENDLKTEIMVPDFNYIFQRPSYIHDDHNQHEYTCDNSKGDQCKINFKLTDTQDKDISSQFECEIGLNFLSNQNARCNPNTIVFPEGKNKVVFRVYQKGNKQNYKEKIIYISNIPVPLKEQPTTKIVATEKAEQQVEKEKINIPDFDYILQRPSYILKISGEEDKYICDKSKGNDCKVNFKIISSNLSDIASDFGCQIELKNILSASGSVIETCNPNTLSIEKGENQITFTVYDKFENENLKQKTIFISNINHSTNVFSEKDISSNSSSESIINQERHSLPYTKIQVQGKISKLKKVQPTRIICYTYNECSINFTSGKLYSSQRKGIHFYWDFGNGKKYYDYNPKSIKFKPGNYKTRLLVSDNHGNYKSEIYKVSVINLYTKTEIKNINSSILSIKDFDIEKEVSNKFKKYSPTNYKIISGYKESLENIFTGKNLGESFSLKNNTRPISTHNKNSTIEKRDTSSSSLNKKRLKILSKNMSLRVVFQKKNLKIYGKTFPDSQIQVTIGKQQFNTQSDGNGKYELKTNSLTEGKYKIHASVFDKNHTLIAQKTSSEKFFSTDYILQLKSYTKNDTNSSSNSSSDLQTINKSLAKQLSLRVALQKKNLKLSGKTLPHSKLFFNIGEQRFSTYANAHGEYELKINSIKVGAYKIIASVYNSGKLIGKKSSGIKTFSSEYINNMKSYLYKKSSSVNTAKQKTQKFTLENYISNNSNKILESAFNIKLFVINMLITILGLIGLFTLLVKKKLI